MTAPIAAANTGTCGAIAPSKVGRKQRDFARETGVGAAITPIGEHHEGANDDGTDDHHRDPFKLHRECTGERRDHVGAQTTGHADGGIAAAALTFGTKQQADCQGDDETRDGTVEDRVEAAHATIWLDRNASMSVREKPMAANTSSVCSPGLAKEPP